MTPFEHSSLRPHGVIVSTDLEGREVMSDTRSCVHCGGHWKIEKGSGRPHAYCRRCGGDTCSNIECLTTCVPKQKRMDDAEKYGGLILPS